MTKNSALENEALMEQDSGQSRLSRRKFFNLAGASTGMIVLAAACSKDDTPPNNNTGVNLGSGDVGILNYAYALEQLEAAFYTKVVASSNTGLSALEMTYMNDIKLHEVAHREFFRNALGDNRIQDLEVNFDSINFSDRTSILATAKAFEDLGVSAYNGAGPLLQSSAFLTLAGKIVSVEARHAALIRDLISNGSFADDSAVDAMGLDLIRTPAQVYEIAKGFLKTSLNISNLPS